MPEVSRSRGGRAPLAVTVGQRVFPIDVARHPRARRYVLRVSAEGRLRLTVPRGASIAAGLSFAAREHVWIDREWSRLQSRSADWSDGTSIWFRGTRVALAVVGDVVALGEERVATTAVLTLRATVERHLRAVATRELPGRTLRLAQRHGIGVERVSIRNQRSRWGSCSARGAIALNWRLVQMPPEVSDYVILHELAHRRHPNHSRRFWRSVEGLCPGWREAERWLRAHGRELF